MVKISLLADFGTLDMIYLGDSLKLHKVSQRTSSIVLRPFYMYRNPRNKINAKTCPPLLQKGTCKALYPGFTWPRRCLKERLGSEEESFYVK